MHKWRSARLRALGRARELAIVRAREKAEKTLGANGADGIGDVEGKVASVATSKLGNERVSISRRHRQARWTGQPPRADALACKTNGRDPRGQTRGVESRKAVASSLRGTVELVNVCIISRL
jgi:hypothetical protein